MNTQSTRIATALAVAGLAVAALAACSTKTANNGGSGGGDTSSAKIAFLMPDQASTRYEQHDSPGFKAEMAKLCPGCKVLYQNANGRRVASSSSSSTRRIAQGAKVIVLDPVDSTAAASLVNMAQAQGVKVIAYDRPIPSTPADYYVSFDNEGIGKAIAQSLVEQLKARACRPPGGGVLQVNGSPTDAAAGLIKKGIHAGLEGSGYKTLAEFDTPDWAPPKAQQWVAGQITRFGAQIVGVVAANDGTGGGAIAAFKAAGVNPVPPVTGNDATIAASAADHRGRPVQHHLQAQRDRGRPPRPRSPSGCSPARRRKRRDEALRHALAAVHAGRGHAKEPQGRDLRQEASPAPRSICTGRYADGCKRWASP